MAASNNALADLLGAAVKETENHTPQAAQPVRASSKPIELYMDTAAPVVVAMSNERGVTTAVSSASVGAENPLASFKMASKYGSSGAGQARASQEADASEAPPAPARDEFEDEEVTLEIGSAAAGGATRDEFDDEFGDDDFDLGPLPMPAAAPQPTAGGAGGASGAAANAAAAKAKEEEDRKALQAAAEAARAQAEAAKVQEAATAAAAAAESQRAAQEERMAALRQLKQQVSGEGEAAAGSSATTEAAVAISAKSKAEQADEQYAASRRSLRSNDQAIAEDEEEEEDDDDEKESPQKVTSAGTAAGGAASSGGAAGGAAGGGAAGGCADPGAGAPPLPAAPRMPTREERLMAQFEEATAAADASMAEGGLSSGPVNPDEDRKAKITYAEACRQLMGGLSAECFQGIVREEWSGASFALRKIPAMRPKLKTSELRQQRDNLLGLAKTPMDRGVLHERVLMSIHRAITKSDALPPRFGPQWEVIGFQGSDPATDLRGAGVLALLQMLHLATRRPKLIESLFMTSDSGTAFPLMTVSINLTQVSLQAMRAGGITKEANKAPPSKGKQGSEPLYEALHNMHAACFLYLLREWKRRKCVTQDPRARARVRGRSPAYHLPLATCHLPLATCHLPLATLRPDPRE